MQLRRHAIENPSEVFVAKISPRLDCATRLRYCLLTCIFSFITSIAFLAPIPAAADIDPMSPWAEMWNTAGYYTTNLESNNFSNHLERFEGRFGVNLIPVAKNTFIKPYVGYVMVYSGDKNYWNNTLAYGAGVRINPFMNTDDAMMRDFKLFIESMQASWLQDDATARSNNIPTEDVRWGFDLWHEWNQKQVYKTEDQVDYGEPWSEVWSNLSYHTTNFNVQDFNGYIFNLQPKWGIYLNPELEGLTEPYVKADLILSSRTGPDWDFLNRADVGLGIRFEPFRKGNPDQVNPIIYKLKVFGEAVAVTYLNGIRPAGRPASDVRVGFDFTLGY